MASTKKWEDLDISNDEAKRLCDAFKNDEFRKMFMEYAEELQDPENRKRYEEELAMLEAEKGMDVKFVHPEPGYVMKTTVDGDTKAFINICKNEHVEKPEVSRALNPKTGVMAPNWSLPHTMAPPRDDTDKEGQKCRVFDVVFHPDAYRMAESNERFRKMLNTTALETIERQFAVKLDKTNVKFPKMTFKGTPQATVIRTKKEVDGKAKGDHTADKDDIFNKIPYPYDNKTSAEKSEENEERARKNQEKQKNKKKEKEVGDAEVPKYSIVHRQEVDFQDYRNAPDARSSTRPKEIVIHIELPLLKSASSANLDIFERRLLLESTTPAKYKLDLDLPFPVDEESGSAKFDKSKKRLTITLPVLKPDLSELSQNGTGIAANKTDEDKDEENDENNVPDLEDDVPELEDDVPELEDDVPELEDDVPDTNSSPLIQVLSSTANRDETSHKPLTNGHVNHSDPPPPKDKDIWTEQELDPNFTQPAITYKMPNYVANQDQETSTFILSVKNAQRDSMSKTFGNNSVQLRFVSVGSGGYPMHYSFMVKFEDDFLIDTTACDVSMSEDNVVMILGKTSESAGIWDKFLVGTDVDHLQEALFVTEKTLSSALDQLDATTMPLNNNDKMPDLEVTDMSDDQLTIQLSNAAAQEKTRRVKKHSESSDDIEVVHSGEVPSLHGILKDRDRTVSESSDEVFGVRGAYRREDSVSSILSTGSASEGLPSESDGDSSTTPSRKKSVSFSEYVDRTTYKCNASVSTLHASLKKKNKRCRKKEAKIERRRRRSSGSECEHSSEDQSSSQVETSEGGANSVGDEEDDDDDVIVDHQLPEGPRTEPDDEEEETAAAVVATPAQAKQPSKKNKKSKKKGSKGRKAAAGSSKEGFSENVNAASHTPPETKGESVTSESEGGVDCVANIEDGERTRENGESEDRDSDDAEPGESEPAPKRTTKPADAPETALSWSDGSKCESDVTKCAFNFTNNMMFDLDDD